MMINKILTIMVVAIFSITGMSWGVGQDATSGGPGSKAWAMITTETTHNQGEFSNLTHGANINTLTTSGGTVGDILSATTDDWINGYFSTNVATGKKSTATITLDDFQNKDDQFAKLRPLLKIKLTKANFQEIEADVNTTSVSVDGTSYSELNYSEPAAGYVLGIMNMASGVTALDINFIVGLRGFEYSEDGNGYAPVSANNAHRIVAGDYEATLTIGEASPDF